jgi:hypothetical protein
VNLFEVYCKKRKKSKKKLLVTKNGGVRRGGYTYRAGCIWARHWRRLLLIMLPYILYTDWSNSNVPLRIGVLE